MKKIVLLLAIVALGTGCSKFLEENPESFVNRGGYYKTESQCRSAVNSCYQGLKSVYVSNLFTHLEGTTDLAYLPRLSDVNAILDINPSQCKISTTVWDNSYKSIMYCNAAIAGVEASPIEEGAKNGYLAEAKTMRAFWYYLLTSCFGDVPYYTEDIVDQAAMERAAHLGRMDAVAIRAAMIRELQECFSYADDGSYTGALPQMRANDAADKGYAGWAMGMMLIGKMALWNAYMDTASGTDWFQVAIDALEKLVPVYGALDQYPVGDLYFSVKDAPERIFEIRHTYARGILNYSSNLATDMMPSYNSNTDLYDGVSIPWLGSEAKVSGGQARPTSYFYSVIQPDNGKDSRVDVNLGWRYNGTPFSSGKTRPWMGPKFWCPNMFSTNDSNDYVVFRYADALLLLAECYAAKQEQTSFELYLNQVKTRAGLPSYTVVSWSQAVRELRDERARELFGEFQRKFDLVRWGIWYDTVREYWKNEMDSRDIPVHLQPCHRYLPIPMDQVVKSGNALDNKEYNAYGL